MCWTPFLLVFIAAFSDEVIVGNMAVAIDQAVLALPPVVIVGSGPVGIRVAQELLRLDPLLHLVIYGDEPWEPYNRVRLTQMLAGHSSWADIFQSLQLPTTGSIECRYNCAVVAIDRHEKTVTDLLGRQQPYSRLILAVGSRPHVPDIPGRALHNVFTFRNMSDLNGLLARRIGSRRTVVVGGGLLGLEAAHALQRSHTAVFIIQHSDRLMGRQLDDHAAAMMCAEVESLGIKVYLNSGVQSILGERLVEGVRLRDGSVLDCDTVVFCTGIKPNVELARGAGLRVGRGIRVDDLLQTSNPAIYAVGECTEHNNQIYGLVAPGLEQASVAAHNIVGQHAFYRGSTAVARLKVVGTALLSIGTVVEEEIPSHYRTAVYQNDEKGYYRKLVMVGGRLQGAIAIGEWPQHQRVQEGVVHHRRLWPWQLMRFKRSGELWTEQQSQDVRQWPANAIVCNCTGVSRGVLSAAVTGGCTTVEMLVQCTGASTVCGGCKPRLAEMLGESAVPIKNRAGNLLMGASLLAMLMAFITLFVKPIPFVTTVQQGWHISDLWSVTFSKQVTGFTLLGMTVLALLLSLRKRIKKFSFIDFGYWRALHSVLGALLLMLLILHTGLRMGDNLNFLLMFCFVAIALVGAVVGMVSALERGGASIALGRWRRYSGWIHLGLFWPLPVLLGFHILSSYYF